MSNPTSFHYVQVGGEKQTAAWSRILSATIVLEKDQTILCPTCPIALDLVGVGKKKKNPHPAHPCMSSSSQLLTLTTTQKSSITTTITLMLSSLLEEKNTSIDFSCILLTKYHKTSFCRHWRWFALDSKFILQDAPQLFVIRSMIRLW